VFEQRLGLLAGAADAVAELRQGQGRTGSEVRAQGRQGRGVSVTVEDHFVGKAHTNSPRLNR